MSYPLTASQLLLLTEDGSYSEGVAFITFLLRINLLPMALMTEQVPQVKPSGRRGGDEEQGESLTQQYISHKITFIHRRIHK